MTIDLARLAAGALLVPAAAPEPVAFAADELAAYLPRLFGTGVRRRAGAGPGGHWLALGGAPDTEPATAVVEPGAEWSVRAVDDGALIVGTTPRALVAAAYALLEAAGCRWSPHGPAEEHVPGPGEAEPVVPELVGRPAFARRAWAADLGTWHYSVPDRLAERLPRDRAFIDWMAKTGATGFLFIRHANDTRWTMPELAPDLRRRGLAVEGGGHAIVELLPRALYATHPEYFPLGPTGRSDLGNVCASSREALALVRERALAARAEIPGATDIHLWGLDLFGGGWCACPGCARLSPSDQALLVCNAAAEAIDAAGRVFHLAYHDTLDAPDLEPHPRVWAEFAPRERCYGHALDDPACATNAVYRRALEAHLERFDGRVDVFEYYGDAILFGGCAVPLTDVIARDLAFYRRAGVRGVSCLVFGRYSLWAYGANLEAFARGVSRPADAPAAVAAYCARRFASAAALMEGYLAALERLMAPVVTYGDVLLPPTDASRSSAARAALAAAVADGPRLSRLLTDARAAGVPDSLVSTEAHLLRYTLDVLAAMRDWIDAGADASAAERALESLAAGMHQVRALNETIIGTWGAHDLELTHHFFTNALRDRRRA
jgi:hypothetical protein